MQENSEEVTDEHRGTDEKTGGRRSTQRKSEDEGILCGGKETMRL